MATMRLLKAKLQYYEAKLNYLEHRFSYNPKNFNVFAYTLETNALNLLIFSIKSKIIQKEKEINHEINI